MTTDAYTLKWINYVYKNIELVDDSALLLQSVTKTIADISAFNVTTYELLNNAWVGNKTIPEQIIATCSGLSNVVEVLKLLVKYGADLKANSHCGFNCIHHLIENKMVRSDLLEYLMFQLEIIDEDGDYDSHECGKILLKCDHSAAFTKIFIESLPVDWISKLDDFFSYSEIDQIHLIIDACECYNDSIMITANYNKLQDKHAKLVKHMETVVPKHQGLQEKNKQLYEIGTRYRNKYNELHGEYTRVYDLYYKCMDENELMKKQLTQLHSLKQQVDEMKVTIANMKKSTIRISIKRSIENTGSAKTNSVASGDSTTSLANSANNSAINSTSKVDISPDIAIENIVYDSRKRRRVDYDSMVSSSKLDSLLKEHKEQRVWSAKLSHKNANDLLESYWKSINTNITDDNDKLRSIFEFLKVPVGYDTHGVAHTSRMMHLKHIIDDKNGVSEIIKSVATFLWYCELQNYIKSVSRYLQNHSEPDTVINCRNYLGIHFPKGLTPGDYTFGTTYQYMGRYLKLIMKNPNLILANVSPGQKTHNSKKINDLMAEDPRDWKNMVTISKNRYGIIIDFNANAKNVAGCRIDSSFI